MEFWSVVVFMEFCGLGSQRNVFYAECYAAALVAWSQLPSRMLIGFLCAQGRFLGPRTNLRLEFSTLSIAARFWGR